MLVKHTRPRECGGKNLVLPGIVAEELFLAPRLWAHSRLPVSALVSASASLRRLRTRVGCSQQGRENEQVLPADMLALGSLP